MVQENPEDIDGVEIISLKKAAPTTRTGVTTRAQAKPRQPSPVKNIPSDKKVSFKLKESDGDDDDDGDDTFKDDR